MLVSPNFAVLKLKSVIEFREHAALLNKIACMTCIYRNSDYCLENEIKLHKTFLCNNNNIDTPALV